MFDIKENMFLGWKFRYKSYQITKDEKKQNEARNIYIYIATCLIFPHEIVLPTPINDLLPLAQVNSEYKIQGEG